MITLPMSDGVSETTGTWWHGKTHEGRPVVYISCPGCGESCDLGSLWTIAPDGTVSPSVDHSQPITKRVDWKWIKIQDCTFHDHIKLDGWKP